jgi:hypothetical protein
MKTKFVQLNILLLILGLCSCESKNDNIAEIAKISETAIESSYNLLDIKPNVYHDYFKESDNTMGYSSLKPNPLQETSLVQYSSLSPLAKQKSRIAINGLKINGNSTSKKIGSNESNDIFGKTITFSISTPNAKNSKATNTSEIVMYVPNIVSITNPAVTTEQEKYPLCDSKNFVLEWNADPLNKEGVVVIAEYFGFNAIPSDAQNTHVLNTDYIELDNGKATLDAALFNGIPNLAIVHIILLRGNVALKDIEGESYKFFAESHMRLPIILIKDVSTIAKN